LNRALRDDFDIRDRLEFSFDHVKFEKTLRLQSPDWSDRWESGDVSGPEFHKDTVRQWREYELNRKNIFLISFDETK
jgi:hypothetical protein